MTTYLETSSIEDVALRKESVDRNGFSYFYIIKITWSLSARRAWIEIAPEENPTQKREGRSPQGERG